MSEQFLQYGNSEIKFSIIYSDRKTLGIKVQPNGEVVVKAPACVSNEQIEEKVRKRAAWILKQQRFFQSFKQKMPPRRYVSGESHLYLGKQYILKVKEGKINSVSFKGRSFEIVCNRKSKAETLMKGWYRERAKTKFAEIAEPVIQRFVNKYSKSVETLRAMSLQIYIQQMENRWGSCTPKGKIILNSELIKAPKPCIEYVITHELCHLLRRNHTAEFYKLLTTEMPDWEKWKNKLERIICLLEKIDKFNKTSILK